MGTSIDHVVLTTTLQILHPTHMKPEGAGVFLTRDAGQGFVLRLRPVTDGAAGAVVLRREALCCGINKCLKKSVVCRFDHTAAAGGGHQHALHNAADEPQGPCTEQCCTAEAAITAYRYLTEHAAPHMLSPMDEGFAIVMAWQSFAMHRKLPCEAPIGDWLQAWQSDRRRSQHQEQRGLRPRLTLERVHAKTASPS